MNKTEEKKALNKQYFLRSYAFTKGCYFCITANGYILELHDDKTYIIVNKIIWGLRKTIRMIKNDGGYVIIRIGCFTDGTYEIG